MNSCVVSLDVTLFVPDPRLRERSPTLKGILMESSNAAAWERLGMLLTQRRAQIDPRYGRRTRFAEERHLGHRVVYEIEKARRQNFGDGTIAAIESAYELVPGSLRRTLNGDPLEAATRTPEPGPPANEPPEPVPPGVATAISALVSSLVPAVEVEVRRAQMRNPRATGTEIFTDEYEARIWDLGLEPESRAIGIVAFLRATRAQREAGGGDLNSSRRAPRWR